MSADNEDTLRVPLVYVGGEDMPVLLANNFVIQHEQNEFVLTIGQLIPPILLGSREERLEQAKRLSYVPVKIVAKIGLTRQRLVELISVLQTNLATYDEKQRRGETDG